MLAVYEESELIFQALLGAIRQVREGGGPMSIAIARRMVRYFNQKGSALSDVETLSPRERQVLYLLVYGLTCQQIAGELAVGNETVRTYVK